MRLLGFTVFAVWAMVASSASGFAKEVQLNWAPVRAARGYQIEFLSGGKTVAKRTTQPAWSGNLNPGIYTYRIRAEDRIKRLGNWTAPKTLVVLPPAPKPMAPANGEKLTYYSNDVPVTLRWDPEPSTRLYRVEVTRNGAPVIEKVVHGTTVDLLDLGAGTFSWKVSAVLEKDKKRWFSPGSPQSELELRRAQLAPPTLVFPGRTERIPPPAAGVLTARWDSVEGAEGYVVRLHRFKEPGKSPEKLSEITSTGNEITFRLPGEGRYSWDVRAVAHRRTGRAPAAIGPISTNTFEITRNALFARGHGYIALSTLLAPYEYKLSSALSGYHGSTSATSAAFRLSGEYWIAPKFAVAGAAEQVGYRVGGKGLSMVNLEVLAKTRLAITGSRFGWFIAPKAGLESRGYFQLLPDPVSGKTLSQEIRALGASVGMDVRKQLNDRWSAGAKAGYFLPLALSGVPAGTKISSEASYRNVNIGLQGFYWINRRWSAGAGLYLEKRSIGAQPMLKTGTLSPGNETVIMDQTCFFGSVLWTFGATD